MPDGLHQTKKLTFGDNFIALFIFQHAALG